MARSKWTVMFIPQDQQRVRSLQLSNSLVRLALTGVLIIVVAVAVGGTLLMRPGDPFRLQQLERENGLLAEEVDGMRGAIESLTVTLDQLSAKDEQYRTIAGLPAIDEDVQRVGIGGPGTRTLESLGIYQTNANLGEQLFAASYDLETLTRRATLLTASMNEALEVIEENTERLAATPTISPSAGHLSSLFSRNRRHPILRISRPHQGIDIAAPVGEPILAPAEGKVTFAGNRAGGYGLAVELDHGHGYTTRFAHASRLLVQVGETVERGQQIAEVGATGLVTGPHLHYEVERDGVAVDPLDFIITDALPD